MITLLKICAIGILSVILIGLLKSYIVKTGETTNSLELKFDSYEKACEYIKELEYVEEELSAAVIKIQQLDVLK